MRQAQMPGSLAVSTQRDCSVHPESVQLRRVLNEVYQARGVDFSEYRESLIGRRVAVRVRALHAPDMTDYLQRLRRDKDEMNALLDELTIHTTQFFRDPDVFETLARTVLPEVFDAEAHEGRRSVNIWSAGCSGGQEATTLLILVAEYLGPRLKDVAFTIHGTDIDRWSIEKAVEGTYDEHDFKTMPRNHREKYFLDMGNGRYWRKKEWNRFFKFRRHDLVKQEPLSNMDLVLCRNTFIYFKSELQLRCLNNFAQALRKGGFLVLGLTENVGNSLKGGFANYDQPHHIYRRIV